MRRVSFRKINETIGSLTFLADGSPPSLDSPTMDEFEEYLKLIENDRFLRSVVISSAHRTIFLAGGDLRELASLETCEKGDAMCMRMQGFIRAMEECRFPFIAAVDGGVFGGGCEFLLGCDVVVASRKAFFNFTQVKFGLITGSGGVSRLVRMTGKRNAAYTLMTASRIGAKRAFEMGFVNLLTKNGKAVETAMSVATRIAQMPEQAISSCKLAIRHAVESDFKESLEYERNLFRDLLASEAHKNALRKFLSDKENE